MAKSKGPYFEFVLQRYNKDIEFVFLPGNSSKQVFTETRNALYELFGSVYSTNDKQNSNTSREDDNPYSKGYVRKLTLEDGTPTIAIYHSKVLTVFRAILSHRAFSDFKIKVTGEDRNGERKEKILTNPVQAQESKEIIPYFNKNNNDLTSGRSK